MFQTCVYAILSEHHWPPMIWYKMIDKTTECWKASSHTSWSPIYITITLLWDSNLSLRRRVPSFMSPRPALFYDIIEHSQFFFSKLREKGWFHQNTYEANHAAIQRLLTRRKVGVQDQLCQPRSRSRTAGAGRNQGTGEKNISGGVYLGWWRHRLYIHPGDE